MSNEKLEEWKKEFDIFWQSINDYQAKVDVFPYYLAACEAREVEKQELLNKCAELNFNNNVLKSELNQQKFNNKHNLSIDQQVSDEIKKLQAELKEARELIEELINSITDLIPGLTIHKGISKKEIVELKQKPKLFLAKEKNGN